MLRHIRVGGLWHAQDMATIGYARVSTSEQDVATQERALRAAGADRLFMDEGVSSRKRNRPQWLACRDYLRAGDVLLVYRLDRLAGTTDYMIQLLNELGNAGIQVRSLTEPEIDTTSPMGRALFGVVAVFAQLRVDTIRQNTVDGLERARAEGRVGGRPSKQTKEKIAAAHALRADGITLRSIADTLGVSEATVRRMLANEA